ncbi:hypothetical protein RM572_26440 [Streptomyces sp. DSM 42041]|uniref:Uncharacterized protein n=1 Tax=Streptomyces hazeniae TaxID=3075538 RepID=A0ABU2NZ96_9ACTN|nr:hypothetical protein [Streptomyces sp. DSM 42041]MDT0382302.1 hypothetical protein [Streptomyces sp. DSM 42041]
MTPTSTTRPATAAHALDDPRPQSTISERFHKFDAAHPWVYRELEQLVARRLASGEKRVGMKALFEALRWRHPHGAQGLNNNFTALYARRLLAEHPQWAAAIETRRRRTP